MTIGGEIEKNGGRGRGEEDGREGEGDGGRGGTNRAIGPDDGDCIVIGGRVKTDKAVGAGDEVAAHRVHVKGANERTVEAIDRRRRLAKATARRRRAQAGLVPGIMPGKR
ncbi:hypothetical protein NL676_030547 [Syzygium grande]|nr:hypothetical protein NL676_030547 [Syzygium grande]